MVGCAGGDAVMTCKTERRASGCLGGSVEGLDARRLPRRVPGANLGWGDVSRNFVEDGGVARWSGIVASHIALV
jgi:hypothetical protein